MRKQTPGVFSCVLLATLGACDEKVADPKQTPPPEPSMAAYTAQAKLDLEAVVATVESGEVKSAAELEARLNVEGEAPLRVDVDADGTVDRLRIVEKRAERGATFEIRAIPSSKTEVALESAPAVAELSMEADADAGTVLAQASLTASFSASLSASGSASSSLSATAPVTRTFSGLSVSAEGKLEVGVEANAFVAWTFEVGRPVYVAEVLVAKRVETSQEPDPCWPPGHCKHGLWKATGERPPGQEKHAHGDAGAHGKSAADLFGHGAGKGDAGGKGDAHASDGAAKKDSGKGESKASSASKGKSSGSTATKQKSKSSSAAKDARKKGSGDAKAKGGKD